MKQGKGQVEDAVHQKFQIFRRHKNHYTEEKKGKGYYFAS
jgi:hypothetical protein